MLELQFSAGDHELEFLHPLEVFTAWDSDSAWAALARLEAAHAAGYAIAGMVSYEFGYACNDLPMRPVDPQRAWPLLLFGIYAQPERRPHAPPLPSEEPGEAFLTALDPSIDFAHYENMVDQISTMLRDGDLYQVNYTVPFQTALLPSLGTLDTQLLRKLYERLAAVSHAPHRALVIGEEFAALSLSPELFLAFDGEQLITKPMKGTSTREREADLRSDKNRAEHLMIVDLLRNDLHRVCSLVEVERLFEVERYPTFSTMTSTIRGTRRSNVVLRDILRATFPCGSVTGAPKRAAMQAIATLEPQPRNIYCGSIGYLLADGRGSFNVAIRTLQVDRRHADVRLDLGGGIVSDSVAALEWQEIATKGRLFSQFSTRGI